MNGSALAPAPSAEELRERFAATTPGTIGIEEELMVVEPEGGALLDAAEEVLGLLAGDRRFKAELPASQVEIVLPPAPDAAAALAGLAAARRDLAVAAADRFGFLAAGLYPLAVRSPALSSSGRYPALIAEYGQIARRQLVAALQVHIAVGDADRALAVHDALRSYLPEIAALAANAPFHEGADTGMASFRPKIAEGLPRQGVPPALGSCERFAAALAWSGAATGFGPETWWWEMRLHPRFGTLELRVPDTQTTTADAAAVIGFVVALAAWLDARLRDGERLAIHETWRIEQNRWSANRHGLAGELADLASGERISTRRRILELIEQIAGVAEARGCGPALRETERLLADGGAARQRAVAAELGLEALPGWTASRFLEGVEEGRPAGLTAAATGENT